MQLYITFWISIFVLIQNTWCSETSELTTERTNFEYRNSSNSRQVDSEQLDEIYSSLDSSLKDLQATEQSFSSENFPKITWNLVKNSTSQDVHSDMPSTFLDETLPNFRNEATAQTSNSNTSAFQNVSHMFHDSLSHSENELDSNINDFTSAVYVMNDSEESGFSETTLSSLPTISQLNNDTDMEYFKDSTTKTVPEDIASKEEYHGGNSNVSLDMESVELNSTTNLYHLPDPEKVQSYNVTEDFEGDYVTFLPFSNDTMGNIFSNEKDATASRLSGEEQSMGNVMDSNYTESPTTMESTNVFLTSQVFPSAYNFLTEFVSKSANGQEISTESTANTQEQGIYITVRNVESSTETINYSMSSISSIITSESARKLETYNDNLTDNDHSNIVANESNVAEAELVFSRTETHAEHTSIEISTLESTQNETIVDNQTVFDMTKPFPLFNDVTFTSTSIPVEKNDSSHSISSVHILSTISNLDIIGTPETTSLSLENVDDSTSGNENDQMFTSEVTSQYENETFEGFTSITIDHTNSDLENDLPVMKTSDFLKLNTSTINVFTSEVHPRTTITLDRDFGNQHLFTLPKNSPTDIIPNIYDAVQTVTEPSSREDVTEVDLTFSEDSEHKQTHFQTEMETAKTDAFDIHIAETFSIFSETTSSSNESGSTRIIHSTKPPTTIFKENISSVTEFNEAFNVTSQATIETHREGKHIPFSTTRTGYSTDFTVKPTTPSSMTPNFEKTTKDVEVFYDQIRPEDLTPDERANAITAIIQVHSVHYEREELNEKIIIVHLWLLHAIVESHKNSSQNLTGMDSSVVAFENLPQISYVLPTPEINLPNISLSFIAHNIWRNETIAAEILLNTLTFRCKELKVLANVKHVEFFQGLFTEKYDFLLVIMEKYGVIVLITCLIAVVMIVLLICVVIYYRRKARYSAHSLTDDKLHRNMQEAMGIDLNPAVIILQDEIREKVFLNGSKICSLDDDEGWLAPIDDIPVPEDNNAPCVQDTKL